jgi:hypothetical protein
MGVARSQRIPKRVTMQHGAATSGCSLESLSFVGAGHACPQLPKGLALLGSSAAYPSTGRFWLPVTLFNTVSHRLHLHYHLGVGNIAASCQAPNPEFSREP